MECVFCKTYNGMAKSKIFEPRSEMVLATRNDLNSGFLESTRVEMMDIEPWVVGKTSIGLFDRQGHFHYRAFT